MDVRGILSQPDRTWEGKTPASEAEIARLQSVARVELPAEYLELLRLSNGGEGPLALTPLWFQLYAVNDCVELCHRNSTIVEQFPSHIFFGSNGGMESIAFDLRTAEPWQIVSIDLVAGPESAERIAPNISAFIKAIGL